MAVLVKLLGCSSASLGIAAWYLTSKKHQNVYSQTVISCFSWTKILINGQIEVLPAESIARWLNS